MNAVKVSPKFQVVIPKEIRSRLSISAGDSLQVIPFEGRIELVPSRDAKELRGIARGIETAVKREKFDRV
jgi:AbrB family looped-hinge helix DNA binding protein|tara:strand:+ start:376 stop:585 length:210 start_codon:yes stop_codon:yes gene_type:complete